MMRSYKMELKRGVKKSQMSLNHFLFVCSIAMALYNTPITSILNYYS